MEQPKTLRQKESCAITSEEKNQKQQKGVEAEVASALVA